MADSNPISVPNVSAAFELLLEEVEAEIEATKGVILKIVEAGEFSKVLGGTARGEQLSALRDKITAVRREWDVLGKSHSAEPPQRPPADQQQRRQVLSARLKKGQRTREEAFYKPILQALVDLGGSAKLNEVSPLVERAMRDILGAVDYQPLPSDPKRPRWVNTAQWARNSLVGRGLMKKDSPYGTWEISEEGRRSLLDNPDNINGRQATPRSRN
jgi:restriction system protein